MTIQELVNRDLKKAEINLQRAKVKPNVTSTELEHCEELYKLRTKLAEIILREGEQTMSKEKQIEEIQNTLIKIAKQPIMIEGLEHWSDAIAESLYNAGYRKQSEGEWIADAWDNQKEEWVTIPYNKLLHADAFCSLCKKPALLDGAEYGVASNYCPNCGAKMKGGAE